MFPAASAVAQTIDQFGTQNPNDVLAEPTPVAGLENVVKIDAGNADGYALEANGTVHAWGGNSGGNLGDGGTGASPQTAVQVQFPAHVRIVAIGEAEDSGMAVDSEGNGWVWGHGPQGSLCRSSGNLLTPVEVLSGVVAVQGGEHHSLWLTNKGTVKACGSNVHGRLGLGEGVEEVDETTEILGLSNVVEISAGVESSAARTSSGEMFYWGDNAHGEAGLGSFAKAIWTPQRVLLPEPVVQISEGGDYASNGSSFAIGRSGELFAWGANNCGQVPGDERRARTPFATGLHFKEAVTGGEDGLALDAEGNVWAWGCATGGALGDGITEDEEVAPFITDTHAVQVSATAKHSMDLR